MLPFGDLNVQNPQETIKFPCLFSCHYILLIRRHQYNVLAAMVNDVILTSTTGTKTMKKFQAPIFKLAWRGVLRGDTH